MPEIKVDVTEHQAQTIMCNCGKIHTSDYPAGINAPVQYGSGLKSLGNLFYYSTTLANTKNTADFP